MSDATNSFRGTAPEPAGGVHEDVGINEAAEASALYRSCAEAQRRIGESGKAETRTCECGQQFLAHRHSRATRCCTCRVRARQQYVRGWAGTGTDPLPGYPKIEPFQTMEQVREYLAQERIDCLLCGRRFKMLNTHLLRVHKIGLREYKLKCGLPFTRGLVSTPTRTLLSEIAAERLDGESPEQAKARMDKAREAQRGQPPADQIHGSPAILNMRREAARKAVESENHFSRRKAIIPWRCTECGAETMVGETFAITNACRVLCRKCRNRHHRASQEKWAAMRGIDIKEWRREIHRRYRRRKQGGGGEQNG